MEQLSASGHGTEESANGYDVASGSSSSTGCRVSTNDRGLGHLNQSDCEACPLAPFSSFSSSSSFAAASSFSGGTMEMTADCFGAAAPGSSVVAPVPPVNCMYL